MTARRDRSRTRRQSPKHPTDDRGLWDAVPSPAPPEPIQVASHPASLIESLGPPALRGSGDAVEKYVASVVERAAGLATALAASAGLLDDTDNDEPAR